MPQRTIRSQLGQVVLALVNATLMLVVLLVLGLWLLIGRRQDFAANTAKAAAGVVGSEPGERMAKRAAVLDDALAKIVTMTSRVDTAITSAGSSDGPTVAELGALRTDVQALRKAVTRLADTAATLGDQPADAVSSLLHQILQGFATRLADPQPLPT